MKNQIELIIKPRVKDIGIPVRRIVSSDQDKIDQARAAWQDGSYPQVPGETEKIPLPEDVPKVP